MLLLFFLYLVIIDTMDNSKHGKMPPLIWIAKRTYSLFLKAGGRLRLQNDTDANLKKGNYLYLLNHAGIMDPVLVSSVVPRHVRWVAGAYLFKRKFTNLIIGHGCTAISKQQGRGDLSTIKTMKAALDGGDSVGLFPEGTRTWDGEMLDINYTALAKLVRYCGASVLIASLEGAYAQQPRWADFKRKGKVIVHIKRHIDASKLKGCDIDSLAAELEQYLVFSNDEWKKHHEYRYVSDRRAEGIQRLLYLCPCCSSVDSIKAQGSTFRCTECGAEASLDDKDNIVSEKIEFRTLNQWHRWEAENIKAKNSFPEEKGVLFQIEEKIVSNDINVHLKDNVLHIRCNDIEKDNEYSMPLDQISSMVLNAKQTMEFFCSDVLYRVRLMPDACSLKYKELFK